MSEHLRLRDVQTFSHHSSHSGTSTAPSSAWQRQRCSVPKCVHSTPPPALMDNSTQGSEAATDWGRNHENSHQFIARNRGKNSSTHTLTEEVFESRCFMCKCRNLSLSLSLYIYIYLFTVYRSFQKKTHTHIYIYMRYIFVFSLYTLCCLQKQEWNAGN